MNIKLENIIPETHSPQTSDQHSTISGSFFEDWIDHLSDMLKNMQVSYNGKEINHYDEAYNILISMTMDIKAQNKQIFFIGNGASSTMASHIATDLSKNGELACRTFTDAALLTAMANDNGVSSMFADPLARHAKEGDLLVAISSSGASPNIICAVEMAKLLGVTVVGFSAMSETNPLRQKSDLSFYINTDSYGFAETAHSALLHHWVDLIVEEDVSLLS